MIIFRHCISKNLKLESRRCENFGLLKASLIGLVFTLEDPWLRNTFDPVAKNPMEHRHDRGHRCFQWLGIIHCDS